MDKNDHNKCNLGSDEISLYASRSTRNHWASLSEQLALCLHKLWLHTSFLALLSNNKGERAGQLEMTTCLLNISKQPTRTVLMCSLDYSSFLFCFSTKATLDIVDSYTCTHQSYIHLEKASSNTWISHEAVWLVHELKEIPRCDMNKLVILTSWGPIGHDKRTKEATDEFWFWKLLHVHWLLLNTHVPAMCASWSSCHVSSVHHLPAWHKYLPTSPSFSSTELEMTRN